MTGVNRATRSRSPSTARTTSCAGNFGPADLVDPATSKVIGSYVVNGNRDPDGR